MGRPLTESVLVDVAAAVKTAWSPAQIEIDRPQIAADNFPYAHLAISSMTRLSGSPTEQTYMYEIRITGRFAYPSSSTTLIGSEKIARANDLINALMGSTTLKAPSYGTLQDVPTIEYDELDGTSNRAYEVRATYQIAITGTMRP